MIVGFLVAGFAYADCLEFDTKEKVNDFASSIKKAFRDEYIVRRIPNYTQFYQLSFRFYDPIIFTRWYITGDTLFDKLYNLQDKSYVYGVVTDTKIKTITLKKSQRIGSSWDPDYICTYDLVYENAYPSEVEFTMTSRLPESV